MSSGAGPALTFASMEFSLHRHEAARERLLAVENKAVVTDNERRAIADLRGAMALEEGEYALAEEILVGLLETSPSPKAHSRVALLRWRTGDFDGAEMHFREAAATFNGLDASEHAWYQLQLGLLDLFRGRYADALDHYEDGNDILDGYWLIEEHIAEILAVTGQLEEARTMYIPLVAETQSPELMGALAGVLEELGDDEGSADYIAQAEAVYTADLESHAEAAIGHALAHYIDQGDAELALELAERKHELRAGGPAKVSLIDAYLLNGRLDDAREVAAELADSAFVAAEGFAAQAAVAYASGETARALELLEQAQAINPDI